MLHMVLFKILENGMKYYFLENELIILIVGK